MKKYFVPMEYPDSLKIKFLLVENEFIPSKLRKIKYKIQNYQLPWWKRNFIFNPWRPLFWTDVSGHTHRFYDRWQYEHTLKPLNTLGEIRQYITKQNERIEDDEEW